MVPCLALAENLQQMLIRYFKILSTFHLMQK